MTVHLGSCFIWITHSNNGRLTMTTTKLPEALFQSTPTPVSETVVGLHRNPVNGAFYVTFVQPNEHEGKKEIVVLDLRELRAIAMIVPLMTDIARTYE